MLKLKNLVVLVLSVVLLSSCGFYNSVEVGDVKNIELKGMANNILSLKLDVHIKNPNGYKLKIKKMNVDVTINKQYLGTMTIQKPVIVPKKSDQSHSFFVDVEIKNMLAGMSMFYKMKKMKNVELELKGKMKVKAMMRNKTIDISEKHSVNL
ncbi:MAG: LEA type 2 family protein [Bacteroidales bacterium]|nr:LEA type 2 family protein [Bacteroidales bacterium]